MLKTLICVTRPQCVNKTAQMGAVLCVTSGKHSLKISPSTLYTTNMMTKILHFIYISGVLKWLVTPVWLSYICMFTWRGRTRKYALQAAAHYTKQMHTCNNYTRLNKQKHFGYRFQEKSSGWLHSQVGWSTATSPLLSPLFPPDLRNFNGALFLTHCVRVTQICVFNTVKLGTAASFS